MVGLPSNLVVAATFVAALLAQTQRVHSAAVGHTVRNGQIMEQLRASLNFDLFLTPNYLDDDEEQGYDADGDMEALMNQAFPMRDKYGNLFDCGVSTDIEPGSKRKHKLVKPEDITVESVTKVLDELTGVCQVIKKDYWSYEWCHNSKIRQFHSENGQVTMDWSLGRFKAEKSTLSHQDVEYDGDEPKKTSELHRSAVHTTRPTYFSQRFEGGQNCDETGKPRTSEVRFYCCPDAEGAKRAVTPVSFQQLEEVPLCNYQLTVCSPLLCEAGLQAPESVDAWTALRPLVSLCFQKNYQWWTYELCFERHVRQFHVEQRKVKGGKSAETITDDNLLGKFDPSAPPLGEDEIIGNLVPDKDAKVELFLDKGPEKGIVQVYSGGSPCELTGGQRQTFVRFVCKSPDSMNKIISIEEVATCRYSVVFHTPYICKHKLFRKNVRSKEKLTCSMKQDEEL